MVTASLIQTETPPATDDRYPVPALYDGELFRDAPELATLARTLVDRHDATLGHLHEFRVAFLWKAKGGTSGGKPVLGRTVKPSGLTAYYAKQPTFIVHLAADHCRSLALTSQQVEALLFRQLLQTAMDPETDAPILVAPDFVGFVKELTEYGAWQPELRQMARASQQLSLFDEDEADEESE